MKESRFFSVFIFFIFVIVAFSSPSTNALVGGTLVKSLGTVADRSVVVVELLDSANQLRGFCTGSVIGPNTILTAAHCFDPKLIKNMAGFQISFLETKRAATPQRILRRGLQFVQHPQYNTAPLDEQGRARSDHDMAVARFDGELPPSVTPIAIDTDRLADYAGRKVVVYGFGRNKDFSGITGEDVFLSTGNLVRGEMIIDSRFALMGDRYQTDPSSKATLCEGDSGGPQFLIENEVVRQVGVNAGHMGPYLANGFRSCSESSLATKINVEAEWIHWQQKLLNQRQRAKRN
jgi:hypothetical protein